MIPLLKGPLFRFSLYFVYEMYAVKLSVRIVILFKGTDQIQNTHHDDKRSNKIRKYVCPKILLFQRAREIKP